MNLSFSHTDNGNCRVYVRDADRRLLCFQLASQGRFELFRCTQDGEPEHEIRDVKAVLDRLPEDGSVTARDFLDWYRTPCAACGFFIASQHTVTIGNRESARSLGVEIGDEVCRDCYGQG